MNLADIIKIADVKFDPTCWKMVQQKWCMTGPSPMRKNLCTVLKCSLRLYCSVRSLTRELDACGKEYRVVGVCVCVHVPYDNVL